MNPKPPPLPVIAPDGTLTKQGLEKFRRAAPSAQIEFLLAMFGQLSRENIQLKAQLKQYKEIAQSAVYEIREEQSKLSQSIHGLDSKVMSITSAQISTNTRITDLDSYQRKQGREFEELRRRSENGNKMLNALIHWFQPINPFLRSFVNQLDQLSAEPRFDIDQQLKELADMPPVQPNGPGRPNR